MSATDFLNARAGRARIPLAVKLLYTAFVAVLVPYYLRSYGPTNFFYFCDVALLMTVAALWLESPILASAPAVGILLPQALWIVDFLATAAGHPVAGMTAYMYDGSIPRITRFLSFFHFWLPLLLLWALSRLGYDRRGFRLWSVVAWVLLVVSYAFLPAPPAPADKPWLPVNVNYVYGFSDRAPQTWLPPLAYFAAVGCVLQFLIFWPTHLVLTRLFPDARPAD